MSYLTREQILNADDLVTEDVEVPEWGKGMKVCVMSLSGTERDAFEESTLQGRGKNRDVNMKNFRAKLIVRSVVDPQTQERVFSETDVVALGRKNAAALQRVFDVATRLSGLSKEDVEELTKNSDEDQSEDSISA